MPEGDDIRIEEQRRRRRNPLTEADEPRRGARDEGSTPRSHDARPSPPTEAAPPRDTTPSDDPLAQRDTAHWTDAAHAEPPETGPAATTQPVDTRPDAVATTPVGTPARTERRVDRAHAVDRTVQVVDYLFYLLYGLLGIRFVLSLVGATENAGFVQFIHSLTDPFYAPFTGIVSRPAADGGVIDVPLLIALVAYVVLHIAVRGLIKLFMPGRRSSATR